MTPADVVRQEWQRAVTEFGLRPGSPTEVVTARILERLAILSARSDRASAVRAFAAAQPGEWSVSALLKHVGDRWTRKEIYNTVTGLDRAGMIQRRGYGVYR